MESSLFQIDLGVSKRQDEHAANAGIGAADSQPGGGGAAPHLSSAARADVAADLKSRPRRTYRKRSDDDSAALQGKINEAIAAQLDALHDPKAWAALLGLPADAALTITGKDRWKLSDEERNTLGITGSAAARTMMITNPRALAFMMLGSALFATYLPRAVAEMKELAAKKITEKKDAPKQA